MGQTPTKDETQETLKSAHLLAKGYEPVIGLTVPVGTSNQDLGVENSEPKNAEKLSIDVGPGKEKLNLSRRYQRADLEWDYVRQTYYMTPEEICAISRIAYQENCKKSDLLRQLLDSALEEYYPGILEDVAEEAQRLRDDRSHPTRRYGVPE